MSKDTPMLLPGEASGQWRPIARPGPAVPRADASPRDDKAAKKKHKKKRKRDKDKGKGRGEPSDLDQREDDVRFASSSPVKAARRHEKQTPPRQDADARAPPAPAPAQPSDEEKKRAALLKRSNALALLREMAEQRRATEAAEALAAAQSAVNAVTLRTPSKTPTAPAPSRSPAAIKTPTRLITSTIATPSRSAAASILRTPQRLITTTAAASATVAAALRRPSPVAAASKTSVARVALAARRPLAPAIQQAAKSRIGVTISSSLLIPLAEVGSDDDDDDRDDAAAPTAPAAPAVQAVQAAPKPSLRQLLQQAEQAEAQRCGLESSLAAKEAELQSTQRSLASELTELSRLTSQLSASSKVQQELSDRVAQLTAELAEATALANRNRQIVSVLQTTHAAHQARVSTIDKTAEAHATAVKQLKKQLQSLPPAPVVPALPTPAGVLSITETVQSVLSARGKAAVCLATLRGGVMHAEDLWRTVDAIRQRLVSVLQTQAIAAAADSGAGEAPGRSFKRAYTIDTDTPLCPFDIAGTCNDPSCAYQHFRTILGVSAAARRARTGANTASLAHQLVATVKGMELQGDVEAVPQLLGRRAGAFIVRELQIMHETPERAPTSEARYYAKRRQRSAPETSQDEASWLARAFDALPLSFNAQPLASSSATIDEDAASHPVSASLAILSRGLEVHKRSESLWLTYLDLYQCVRGPNDARVRRFFAHAIAKVVPTSQLLWWRYVQYETTLQRRLSVLAHFGLAVLATTAIGLVEIGLAMARALCDAGLLRAATALLECFCEIDETSLRTVLTVLRDVLAAAMPPDLQIAVVDAANQVRRPKAPAAAPAVARCGVRLETALSLQRVHVRAFGMLMTEVFAGAPYEYALDGLGLCAILDWTHVDRDAAEDASRWLHALLQRLLEHANEEHSYGGLSCAIDAVCNSLLMLDVHFSNRVGQHHETVKHAMHEHSRGGLGLRRRIFQLPHDPSFDMPQLKLSSQPSTDAQAAGPKQTQREFVEETVGHFCQESVEALSLRQPAPYEVLRAARQLEWELCRTDVPPPEVLPRVCEALRQLLDICAGDERLGTVQVRSSARLRTEGMHVWLLLLLFELECAPLHGREQARERILSVLHEGVRAIGPGPLKDGWWALLMHAESAVEPADARPSERHQRLLRLYNRACADVVPHSRTHFLRNRTVQLAEAQSPWRIERLALVALSLVSPGTPENVAALLCADTRSPVLFALAVQGGRPGSLDLDLLEGTKEHASAWVLAAGVLVAGEHTPAELAAASRALLLGLAYRPSSALLWSKLLRLEQILSHREGKPERLRALQAAAVAHTGDPLYATMPNAFDAFEP
eukprot:Unigene958_Nuclearia_a/m.3063 Unigene958_Nuclearia_a/g.3063  ORF Unigene958_Nuclearia_a/g.3063 Unigene958_Nuclearia_a/m.3063 type:complete len:1342 (+) Unigene958_Nuclearia_a:31-4056(+)